MLLRRYVNRLLRFRRSILKTSRNLKLSLAQEEFMAMASHQLRPQLTAAEGYVELLERTLPPQSRRLSETKELLDLMRDSLKRMSLLVGDMLNTVHITTTDLVLTSHEFDMVQLVDTEIDRQRRLASKKSIKLHYLRPPTPILAQADSLKLREVVLNLLDNAIQYSHLHGHVIIRLRKLEKAVLFTVEDSGIGVPISAQAKLFTKFYRASNAKSVRPSGTGIGLFATKRVIDAHSGELIFKSEEYVGSTFGFKIPLQPPRL